MSETAANVFGKIIVTGEPQKFRTNGFQNSENHGADLFKGMDVGIEIPCKIVIVPIRSTPDTTTEQGEDELNWQMLVDNTYAYLDTELSEVTSASIERVILQRANEPKRNVVLGWYLVHDSGETIIAYARTEEEAIRLFAWDEPLDPDWHIERAEHLDGRHNHEWLTDPVREPEEYDAAGLGFLDTANAPDERCSLLDWIVGQSVEKALRTINDTNKKRKRQ